MGLLDLFKKKKFDETDLKSITYKRYWLDAVSTILIPSDWEVTNTDRFVAKTADDRANLTVMSSEEPLKGEITKEFFENLKGDFFKDYEKEGFTALDETIANERYISKTFQTYDEVEYHFTCAKKIEDKAIITELILRHKDPYSLEIRELVDKMGMSIQYVADFTRLFAERLITKNPNVQVRKTNGLEIEWMLKSEPGQLITSFLDNAYAEYMHRSDFYLSEIIEKYASSILETIPKEKPKATPKTQPAKEVEKRREVETPKVIIPEPPKEEPVIITAPPKETAKAEIKATSKKPVKEIPTNAKEEPTPKKVEEKKEGVKKETPVMEPTKEPTPKKGKELIFPDFPEEITKQIQQQEELPKQDITADHKEDIQEKDTRRNPVFPDIKDFVFEEKAQEEKKKENPQEKSQKEVPIQGTEEFKEILDLTVDLDTTEQAPTTVTPQEPIIPQEPVISQEPLTKEEDHHHLTEEEVITGKLLIKKEEIFPLVRTTTFIEELKEEIPNLLYENINSELGVIYLVRDEKISLTTEDLKDLHLDRLALKALSVQNLIDQIEVGVEEEGSRYTIIADGKFEASFLVVSELWSKDNIPVEGTIIVGVPSNNVLLITGSANPTDMDWIRHRVAQAYVESNIPISEKLFEIKGNALIPMKM